MAGIALRVVVMTASRVESELVILRMIIEADGEYCEFNDLNQRDFFILNDLLKAGIVDGQTTLDGGSYRSNLKTDNHFKRLASRLHQGEIETQLKHANSTVKGRIPSSVSEQKDISWKLIVTASVGVIGFAWFVFAEVVSPEKSCRLLPDEIATWLTKCDLALQRLTDK